MSKKHDAVFDDILGNFDDQTAKKPEPARAGARFLKRSTTIGDRLSGDLEEKTLRWVDPAECRMWEGHNRAYDLLTEENCRDLIDGIRSQGRQEFPAIVRHAPGKDGTTFEVICGARRHFAVTWLRANNYPQYKYLIDMRDLNDEEAFRLADIENRDREDISDYERAVDYAKAIEAYYGGKQKTMAARLEVGEAWLSRYLALARLPAEIVSAYASIHDIKESHARQLKPLLAESKESLLDAARKLSQEQSLARLAGDTLKDGTQVLSRLKGSCKQSGSGGKSEAVFVTGVQDADLVARRKGRSIQIEFREGLPHEAVAAALEEFLDAYREANLKMPVTIE